MLPRILTLAAFLAAVLAVGFLCAAPVAAQSAPLPDDRDQYHLVVLTAPAPGAAGEALLNSLRTDPTLAKIAAQCATHRLSTSSDLYRQRYAAALPADSLPAIALVRSDGGVIYKASADNLPSDPAKLAESILYYGRVDRQLRTGGGTSWDARTQCPDGQCPTDPQSPFFPRPFGPNGPLNPDQWIPDTVTVQPTVNVPGGTVGLAVGGVVSLVLLIGLGVAAVLAIGGAILYFTRR